MLSGSDDFNLYMWKVSSFGPEKGKLFNYLNIASEELVYYFRRKTFSINFYSEKAGSSTVLPHMVLYGHRSIVNQVRYNPQYCLIASSGVEKIIKVPLSFTVD